LRIGQVIWPRRVVAVAQIEVHKGRMIFRPDHYTPPAEVSQMTADGCPRACVAILSAR
jgi:hypothetical protein